MLDSRKRTGKKERLDLNFFAQLVTLFHVLLMAIA